MSDHDSKGFVKKAVKSEDTTTSGGGSTTHGTAISLMGYSDTQINQGSSVIDAEGQKVLAQYSLDKLGNLPRQARTGRERTIFGKFGEGSTKQAVHAREKGSDKAPQLTLGNVLGLGNLPKPGGPKPR